jgi:3-hydroxyisobutyrate dehydrogenase-like beta-hydroxyacid dehydrogenase
MTTVGVVGPGTRGAAIASRLVASGHRVHGTNRSESKPLPLIERGLRRHVGDNDQGLTSALARP